MFKFTPEAFRTIRGQTLDFQTIRDAFRTIQVPDGVLTFSRICIPPNEFPNFSSSKKPLRKPIVRLTGTVEDCLGATQMDFANKFLGGGVLNHGCVQEEIRFVICPELLVSLLFTERMNSNEAVLMRGCERFSSYTGYANSFEWLEDFVDDTPRDEFNRIYADIVALDAVNYRYSKVQFQEANINRELKKCFCGFSPRFNSNHRYPVIATGNWGCGAFRGDRQLKFLIQLLAASEADRDLVYYTFNHQETVDNLNHLWSIIYEEKLTIGDVYKLLVDYYAEIINLSPAKIKAFNLVEYFKIKFNRIES